LKVDGGGPLRPGVGFDFGTGARRILQEIRMAVRRDDLIASGALASLLASGAKLTDQVLLISALEEDADGSLSVAAKRIGGPLLFGRIWDRLGIAAVLEELLKHRSFEFAVERAVFVATLHRLFVSRSDRDCSCWMEDYDIAAVDPAPFLSGDGVAWRGIGGEAGGALSPRCVEDVIEEKLRGPVRAAPDRAAEGRDAI
jgi:hypothetical protein